jgi:hypothetical protein
MPTPSNYKPTTSNPKLKSYFPLPYKDSAGNIVYEASPEKFIDYANNGNSYIGPMFNIPNGYASTPFGMAINEPSGLPNYLYNKDIDQFIEWMKQLTPGKRCIGMNFANGDPEKYHIEDALFPENYGITGLGETLWWKTTDDFGGWTQVENTVRSIWADTGITRTKNFWNNWLNYVYNQDVEIDSVMFAAEGGI